MERGSSVVECRTRYQVSPASNPPSLYRFEDWAFSFSQLTPHAVDSAVGPINECLATDSGGNVSDLVFVRA